MTSSEILGYPTCTDYTLLVELAKQSSIICLVQDTNNFAQLGRTFFDGSSMNMIAAGETIVSKTDADFFDMCRKYNLEFLIPDVINQHQRDFIQLTTFEIGSPIEFLSKIGLGASLASDLAMQNNRPLAAQLEQCVLAEIKQLTDHCGSTEVTREQFIFRFKTQYKKYAELAANIVSEDDDVFYRASKSENISTMLLSAYSLRDLAIIQLQESLNSHLQMNSADDFHVWAVGLQAGLEQNISDLTVKLHEAESQIDEGFDIKGLPDKFPVSTASPVWWSVLSVSKSFIERMSFALAIEIVSDANLCVIESQKMHVTEDINQ